MLKTSNIYRFTDTALITAYLSKNGIPVTYASYTTIETPYVTLNEDLIASNLTGEILYEINLDKTSESFSDLFITDLVDSDILIHIINDHIESLNGVA